MTLHTEIYIYVLNDITYRDFIINVLNDITYRDFINVPKQLFCFKAIKGDLKNGNGWMAD